jgi:AcrR family transcriptional regulator
MFEEHGLPDARIADIAERAGASYGSFYNYFESKEAVFRELAGECMPSSQPPSAP